MNFKNAFYLLLSISPLASGFYTNKLWNSSLNRNIDVPVTPLSSHSIKDFFITSAVALVVLAGDPQQAIASSTAGQISLNSIPPTAIKIDLKDLPVIGNVVSGTYTKVDDKSLAGSPSVVISSPKDKFKAVQNAVSKGHLEVDIDGILKTHLEVEVASNEPGTLTAKIDSPLIPKLPFKNSASGDYCVIANGKKSDWNKVVNMGDGNPYYYNTKTGVTQYTVPDKI